MAAKISKGSSEADQLFKATQSGDVEKVREVLECGKCNVNCTTDSSGWTPLGPNSLIDSFSSTSLIIFLFHFFSPLL